MRVSPVDTALQILQQLDGRPVMRHLAWATARILLGLGKRKQNSKFLRFSGDYATSSRYQT